MGKATPRLGQTTFSDAFWQRVEPLLPSPPRGGRPWIGNHEVLTGILLCIASGSWEMLPHELGWRRLRDWQAAGVWHQLHELLLAELSDADKID